MLLPFQGALLLLEILEWRFLEELDVPEQWIPCFHDANLDDEQEDNQDAYRLELFIVGAVDNARHVALLQLGEVVVQRPLGIAGIIHVDILPLACLRQLAAHLLVQGSHHRVAGVIFQIRAVAHRDWGTLGVSDTQDIYVDALLVGHLCSLLRPLFVVFAISNHDDGSAHVVLLGEALGGEADGLTDVGALGLD